jgi:DNA-binding NtrC family response regulator
LGVDDLPAEMRDRPSQGTDIGARAGMSMAEIEKRALEATLRLTGGDKQRAAAILGIGLRTLYRKIKEYGIP